jgi:hypothetical protein
MKWVADEYRGFVKRIPVLWLLSSSGKKMPGTLTWSSSGEFGGLGSEVIMWRLCLVG